jgi:hypothetical protein
MVKTEDIVVPMKVKLEKGRAQKFNNKHLPEGCQGQFKWCRHYVPTYLWFLSSYPKVWAIPDNDAVKAMQKIWDDIYGDEIPYDVNVNCAVFKTVCPPSVSVGLNVMLILL